MAGNEFGEVVKVYMSWTSVLSTFGFYSRYVGKLSDILKSGISLDLDSRGLLWLLCTA